MTRKLVGLDKYWVGVSTGNPACHGVFKEEQLKASYTGGE
jgi:hypothetical protein